MKAADLVTSVWLVYEDTDGIAHSITGDVSAISATRGGRLAGVVDDIETGTLTATIVSADLDPATSPTLSRGTPAYLVSLALGVRLFTGVIDTATVDYRDLKYDTDELPAITVTIVDAQQPLSNLPGVYGYTGALADKVAALLAGTGIDWIVDGTAGAGTAGDILSVNNSASVWYQLVLARNSTAANLYVNRDGKIVANTNPSATTWAINLLDAATSPTGVTTGWDTRALINMLTITRSNRNETDGQSTYGPYVNQASKAKYGPLSAQLDIIDGTPSTLANTYLSRTGTPAIVPATLTYDPGQTPTLLGIELYDLVTIANHPKVDQTTAWVVIGIEHSMSGADGWAVTLRLRAPIVADSSVIVTTPTPGADTGPVDALPAPIRPYEPTLSTKLGTVKISWNGTDQHQAAVPAEIAYAEVYRDDTGPIGRISTAGGDIIDAGLTYGQQYAYTLRLVDRYGRQSADSDPSYITPVAVVDTDIIGKIINAADNVIDGSITSANLAGKAVTAGKIDVGAVDTDEIKNDAISADKIQADAVTANAIVAGAVITEKLAANAVTVDKLAAASVTTDKLRVGVATNIAADQYFVNSDLNTLRFGASGWTLNTSNGRVRFDPGDSMRLWVVGVRTAGPSGNPPDYATGRATLQSVLPGQTWYMQGGYARSIAGGVRWQVNFYGLDGTPTTATYPAQADLAASATTLVTGTVTVPADAYFMAVAMLAEGGVGGWVEFSQPKVWLQTSSVLIEDGAITAAKIQALAVTADKIAANAVTAGTIAAGAIDAMTITGAVLVSGNIMANGRTSASDTNPGYYLRGSDGYMNINDTAGDQFFEIHPTNKFFRVGPTSGNYMQYSSATGKLTVAGSVNVSGAITTGGRTAYDDTLTGWYIADSGYANVNAADGTRFLTINPKDTTRYFQIGDSSSGAYLNYTVNTGSLTLAGEILTDKAGKPRVHIANNIYPNGNGAGMSFETAGAGGTKNPGIYALTNTTNAWPANTLVMRSGGYSTATTDYNGRSETYMSPNAIFSVASNLDGTDTTLLSLDRSAGFRLNSTNGPGNVGCTDFGLAASGEVSLRSSSNAIYMNGVPSSSASLFQLGITESGHQIVYLGVSLSALKADQRPLDTNYAVLDLEPTTWLGTDGFSSRRSVGLIVEQAADVSASNADFLDEVLLLKGGKLAGLDYSRLAVYLLGVVRDMNNRLLQLEGLPARTPATIPGSRKYESANPDDLVLSSESETQ